MFSKPSLPAEKTRDPAIPVGSDGPGLGTCASPGLGEDSVTIPLSAIIFQVPKELHGKLAPAGAAGHDFTISKAKVIGQLPGGAVKVTFGELRRTAPAGLFTNSRTHDGQMVDLPLSQILRQLRPEDYAVRRNRAMIEPPTDVTDLFGQKGECLAAIRVLSKHENQSPGGGESPKPAARVPSPLIPPPHSPAPKASPAPGLIPTPRLPPANPPAAKLPTAPRMPAVKPAVSPPKPTGTLSPLPTRPPTPRKPEVVVLPVSPENPGMLAPASAPPPPMTDSREAMFLVALDDIARGWPEEIRDEIARLKIPHVKCAFPTSEVCAGLKCGKMEYTWEQLRSRIHPPPSDPEPTDYGETIVALPLNVVTPLFLEFIRSTTSEQKSIDADRVTEFFRKAQGKAPPPPPAAGGGQAAPAKTGAASRSTTTFRKKSHTTQFRKHPGGPDDGGSLTVSLSLVSASWSPAVLKEIQRENLAEAQLELPVCAVEPGLKQGRIEFPWRQISGWLKPPRREGAQSPHADTVLPLPLSVLAPLYFAQRSPPKPSQMTSDLAEIPDLFSSTKAVAEAPAQPAKAAEPALSTPAPTASEEPAPAATTAAAARPAQNIAELFGEPHKKNWTPNEIVHKTVELPGVQGAMIVLQDGLLVAHCMPPGQKTETLAAFLPQIVGRMSQYAKEFGMGALEDVALTVEKGTLRIYSAGIIYFAALGRQDGDLPLASLRLIAAELGRHTK